MKYRASEFAAEGLTVITVLKPEIGTLVPMVTAGSNGSVTNVSPVPKVWMMRLPSTLRKC